MKISRTLGASVVASALTFGLGLDAQAAVIDFDTLSNGEVVTNQFAEATFSSNPGFEIKVTAQNLGSSLPNFICTAPVGGGIDCLHDVFLDFTSPVSGLTFLGTGIDDTGLVALVDIFVGGVFSSTVSVFGLGSPFTPVFVDASGFSNITGIAIHDVTDGNGIGWDDFTFETSQVPEPATLVLMGLGLAALGLRRRR